jgi:transposase
LTKTIKNDKIKDMYSIDLREKALKYKETHSEAETSEIFGVSVSAIREWGKIQKEQGNVKPKELERSGRKIKDAELKADVASYPDDFNWERAKRFGCTEEAIRKAMKRNKLTRKKEYRIF